ncbi:integrase core domain-containing protein [Limibacillus halophilus]|uniref:integrase core domain-containing protein n=1 Tax=Limibacillus halophilus TaxID=1579333 RepID=UPI003F58E2C9
MCNYTPSKPMKNRFVESFNGRLRGKSLNENLFRGYGHARELNERWRHDYNYLRPHTSHTKGIYNPVRSEP